METNSEAIIKQQFIQKEIETRISNAQHATEAIFNRFLQNIHLYQQIELIT